LQVYEALCFGWIDGQVKKQAESGELAQRFTPRAKPRSHWTELNKERARWLVAQGRMTPAGLAAAPSLDGDNGPPVIPDFIKTALKAEGEAVWSTFTAFPALYQRVRVGYVAEMKPETDEFKKRLKNLVTNTAKGRMYGQWDDGGRLRAWRTDA
jgi:uncharacterized protein YdeI (YjbR/CyaY-like superfamily)